MGGEEHLAQFDGREHLRVGLPVLLCPQGARDTGHGSHNLGEPFGHPQVRGELHNLGLAGLLGLLGAGGGGSPVGLIADCTEPAQV